MNNKVMNDKKVLVIPCSGIGKPIGTVSRETAYKIVENLRKEKCQTICLALLTSGDKETIDKVKKNYCITIDGCAKHCAKKNVEACNKTPDKSYMILKFAAANPDKKPEGIIDIGNGGRKLVNTIASQIAKDIDKLTKNKVEVSVNERK
ncbi:putative zinc-binding protein [bacterium]|nr:putative zinc-binding protein [bacterium]